MSATSVPPMGLDPFSYNAAQAGAEYFTDIESTTLTLGKYRNRQKASRGKQNTIWTTEKPSKKVKSNTVTTTTTITTKDTKDKKTKSKKTEGSVESSEGELKTFLENPLLLDNDLRNWTLPRVELWCRDTNCRYNQQLWGNHYTSQHKSLNQHYIPGTTIVEVESEESSYQERESSRLSSAYHFEVINSHHLPHNNNQTPSEHDISKNSVPMVLNTHRSNSKSPHAHGNMHINMSRGMNNLNTKDASFTNKADNNFTNSAVIPLPTKASTMTMTQTDTMASSTTTHSSTKTNNTDATTLTIHTDNGGSGSGASTSSVDVSSGSTFVTGFDSSSPSGSRSTTKPVGHDIADYKNPPNRNGPNVYNHSHNSASSGYPSLPYSHHQGFRTPSSNSNPYCPNCSGVVPLNHLDTVSDVTRLKGDPGFWNFNKFQHPLQRDHSFHSVGGFTLNGQYNTNVKKHTMQKFCSSHKISLVVSTFSLLVTIGLLITLFLMKKRGMMNTMDS